MKVNRPHRVTRSARHKTPGWLRHAQHPLGVRDERGARGNSRGRRRSRFPWLPALLATTLLTGLGLSALRVDLIRLRYAAAVALEQKKTLREEVRRLRGRVRELRDPAGLASRATEMGFARPDRRIDLRPRLIARHGEYGNGGGR